MQIKSLAFALTAVFAASLVQANPSPVAQPAPLSQSSTAAGTVRTADQWVTRMTDFTQNASAFKDPATFAAWANAMTDPSMVAAMGIHMMEPGNLLRSMTTMMQPETTRNYMQFMMDPGIYMKWATAMMNPMWHAQMATSMADPSKMMRWAMLPMDPRVWSMGMQAMDPNLYVKWMMTPTDPRAMSLMFAPMNPQLYGSMIGGMMNPDMVGGRNSIWGTFLYPAQPVVQVQGAAPVANPINVFDPSTWLNMMNMFGGMPTLPTMSAPFAMPFGAPPGANPYSSVAPAAPAAPAVSAAPAPAVATVASAAPAAPAPLAAQAGASTTLSLGGDALFRTGKSSVRDLTAEGRANLDDLIAKIKAFGTIDSIRVTGHADRMGRADANKRLSLARANAVANYLKSKGIKARTFTTAGVGDTQPLVTCDMNQPKDALKACLAPNRRVDIAVVGAKK